MSFVFNTIVIASHRRSGQQWTIDALRHNSPDISDSYMSLEQIDPSHDASIPLATFRRQLLSLNARVLINVQELPTANYWTGLDERLFARTILHNSPTIYVHRDGRDVMVSLYLYMQSFSETVRNQSFSQFLRGDAATYAVDTKLSRPGYWAFHAQTWLEKDKVLTISFRDLETKYEATVQKMAQFLGIALNASLDPLSFPGPQGSEPLLDSLLGRIGVWRKRGSRADGPRLGRSGDWRRHFDKSDQDFFMKEAGGMLQRLRYVR